MKKLFLIFFALIIIFIDFPCKHKNKLLFKFENQFFKNNTIINIIY